MATLLVATGPALALLARFTEWQADRKHASLSPKVAINPFPTDELEGFKARNRGEISKLPGLHRWPGQPPIN